MPPLKVPQAFESAGRHLSFTAIASEPNVTPGAISQKIRLQEEFLELKFVQLTQLRDRIERLFLLIMPTVSR